jgi:hypothetical protein
VVGRIESSTPVDRHGHGATLAVERDLAEPGPRATPETLKIGWEELAEGRVPRFRAGERVLVALEKLPGQSIWRQRFPKRDALAVAGGGAAFLRDPDAETVERLARYLAVAPAEREEAPGVEALAAIVAHANDALARGAAERLASIAGLGGKLREPAAASLGAAITDPARGEELRRALVHLAGERKLDGLRDALRAVAREGSPLAGDAWAALAAIDDGIPADTVKQLLSSADPAVRAVAVRWAAGTPEEPRVVAAVAGDPDARVRAAAAEAAVASERADGLGAAFGALFDRAPEVRLAAGQALGRRGGEVVPRLRELALAKRGPDASGPLGALAFAGPEGQAALLEIAHTHADETTRGLARLLLGMDPRKH